MQTAIKNPKSKNQQKLMIAKKLKMQKSFWFPAASLKGNSLVPHSASFPFLRLYQVQLKLQPSLQM